MLSFCYFKPRFSKHPSCLSVFVHFLIAIIIFISVAIFYMSISKLQNTSLYKEDDDYYEYLNDLSFIKQRRINQESKNIKSIYNNISHLNDNFCFECI